MAIDLTQILTGVRGNAAEPSNGTAEVLPTAPMMVTTVSVSIRA